MSIEFHWQLDELLRDFNSKLDTIERNATARFRYLARATGQYTRMDRR